MEDTLDQQMQACQADINECVANSLKSITKRMRHIGLNDHSDAAKWFSTIQEEVANIMSLLVTESEEREHSIMTECIELLKQAQEYCKVLKIPMEPHGQDEERDLREEKVLLKRRLAEYEVLVQAKRNEIKVLQKRNVAVSKVLNEDPLHIDAEIIPTEKQLQDLLHEIEAREMRRFEREETFIKMREKILKLVTDFEIQPTSEFQKKVNDMTVENFIISNQNMILLEEYYNNVTRQSNSIHEKVEELQLKVRSLWDMLSEDIQLCEEFVRRHPGSSQSTLEAFRNELHRCEELRKANIGQFIEKLRADIRVMWVKCHLPQEERDSVKHFNDAYYNEDLLELHERELEQLQHFYNENKTILLHLEEHENLWKKYEHLEEISCNPTRLFNRGGKLLKEEKERNAVQRKLPKIDATLMELAEAYEKTHGKPFRSYGRTVEEIINEKYENREQEKQLKLSARKIKKADLTPGKSTSTLNLARSRFLTPDLKSVSKRRILSPRNATTSKKARVVHNRSIKKIPIIKINGIKHDISFRMANKRRRRSRRSSDSVNQKIDEAYNEFSVQVSKPHLRSTLLNEAEEVLAVPLATSSAPKTPPKPSHIKSPYGSPRDKTAYKLAIASNKKIIL